MVPHGHAGQAKPETVARTSPRGGIITERTAFIGGGAAGIGYAIAARLAPTYRVVIAGRRAVSLETAATRLREQTGADVATLISDLAASADAGYINGTVLAVDGRTETF